MGIRWRVVLYAASVSLAACAPIPTGPSVMVLPGPGKTLEQFQTDDTACRQWAAQEVARTASGEVYGSIIQWRYDMPYQQCMYAKGHLLPIAPALGAIPPPSPPPAAAPPPAGAVPAPPPKAP